jgi:anti-anti-sigma factor
LRLTVHAAGETVPVHYEFKFPYAVVGRGEGCDVLLPNSRVSFRHAYFQVVEGRLFCVDLASRNGVIWPDGPRKYGWVAPDEPIQIGPYIVRLVGDVERDASLRESLADLNPLERYRGQAGTMPKVDLEFRDHSANQPTWSVNRLLTLIGRSPVCKLRFDVPAVSAVHCALLLTRSGLWGIDLLGRGGMQVDGETYRLYPLESGNEISIVNYRIAVFYEHPLDIGAPDRLTDNAAEADTSMDDLESPFLEEALVADMETEPRPDSSDRAAALNWMGTVFDIDGAGATLIVVPTVDGCSFRYQQLHLEANSLQRKIESGAFSNLVVDLRNLNYFGSELIGVLIRLARTVTNGNGRAAFCCASPRMLEVLEGMRLTKLWPIESSREEAIQRVQG